MGIAAEMARQRAAQDVEDTSTLHEAGVDARPDMTSLAKRMSLARRFDPTELDPGDEPGVGLPTKILRGGVKGVAGVLDVLPGGPASVMPPDTADTAAHLFESQGVAFHPSQGSGFAEKSAEELAAGLTVGGAFGPVARSAGGRVLAEVPSALGAAFGREVMESGGAGAEAVGGMAGGVAGSAAGGGVRALRIGGSLARDLYRGRISDANALAATQRIVQDVTSDKVKALDEMARVQALAATVPGVQPTTGPASGVLGLATLQADAFRRRTGEGPAVLDLELARSSGNEGLRKTLVEMRPTHATDPDIDIAEEAAAGVRAHIEARLAALSEAVGGQRGLRSEEASLAARQEYDRLVEEYTTHFGKEFNAIAREAQRRGAVVPTDPIRRALGVVRRETGRFQRVRVPSRIVNQIDRMKDEPLISYADVRSLDEELNALIGKTNPKDKALLRQLGRLKRGTQKAVDALGAAGVKNPTIDQKRALAILRRHGGTEYPDLAERYRAVKAGWSEAKSKFSEGPVGNLGKRREGRLQVAEAETLGMFFKPGDRGARLADEFKRSFADAPDALAAMDDYIVDMALKGVVDESGRFVKDAEKAVAGFVAQNRAALDRFPEALERLRSIKQLTEEAREAGMLGATRSADAVRQGALRLYVENPRAAIREIMELPVDQQGRALDALRAPLVRNEHAMQGLRQVVFDEMFHLDEVGTRQSVLALDPKLPGRGSVAIEATRMFDAIQNARPVLERLFSEAHIKRMEELYELAALNTRIPVPTTERLMDEVMPFKQAAGSGAANQILGPVAQGIRALRLVQRLRAQMGERQINEMLRKAALEPDFMRLLYEPINPRNEERIVRLVASNLTTLPARVLLTEEEERPQSPNAGVLGAGGRP